MILVAAGIRLSLLCGASLPPGLPPSLPCVPVPPSPSFLSLCLVSTVPSQPGRAQEWTPGLPGALWIPDVLLPPIQGPQSCSVEAVLTPPTHAPREVSKELEFWGGDELVRAGAGQP